MDTTSSTGNREIPTERTAAHTESDATRTIVPQAALDAADAKIATWSTAIVDAADTIEQLVTSESLPVPDGVRDLATSTTEKLRSFGTKSGEQDAAQLVAGLQRVAAAHPAASIGIGAAIGATLAALLVRLGSSEAGNASASNGDDSSNGQSGPTAKSAGRSDAAANAGSAKSSTSKGD